MLKLHLGCGTRRLPGFIHIDARALDGIDYVQSVTERLPFPDESCELVYFCHGIEHLKDNEIAPFFQECYRVLRYGGTLRLAVPDFGIIAYAYACDVHLDRVKGLLMGRHDYPENYHYGVYDYETLASVFRVHRFKDVMPWEASDVHPDGYHDYSYATLYGGGKEKYTVSLNVQGIKF